MAFFTDINMTQYLADIGLNSPVPILGVDDGYNQINLAYWVLRDGVLTIAEDKIPSRAKRGRHIHGITSGAAGLYCTDNTEYTVRATLADAEDTRTDDYAKTVLNRVLVHAGLNHVGLTNGQGVAISTGLPIKMYYGNTDSGANDKLINAKTENMLSPVTLGIGKTPSAKIHFHGVYPEAIAGIVDYLMDNSGASIVGRDPNAIRMALDIGGNTTDMAIILPGLEIGAVETIRFGVSHMRDALKAILEDKFELSLDNMSVDTALNTQKLALFGGDVHDVSADWEKAIASVLNEIFSAAEQFRRKYPSLQEMICFGGGASLCESVIKSQFKNIIILDNPDGANARGFLKLASTGDLAQIIAMTNKSLALAPQTADIENAGA